MILDTEAILGAYLRDHPDVAALDARVAVQTPTKFDRPWVRVTWLDAPDRSYGLDHLIDSMVQFDCYASRDGGSVESSLIARTVREALHGLPANSPTGVVVTDVRFVGFANRPDTDLEPARARHIVTAEVDMHPEPTGS